METISVIALRAINGGSTSGAIKVGVVTKTSTAFPTTRPDGTALNDSDYVIATGAASTFPFTVGGLTFDAQGVRAFYDLASGLWALGAGQVISTDEVVIKDKTKESISGEQVHQDKVNEEYVNKFKAIDGNTATEFSKTSPYSKGDYVLYEDKLYRAKQDITAGDFDGTKWAYIQITEELKSKINKLFDSTKGNKTILWKTDASGNLTPYAEPIAPTLAVTASPTSITAGTATDISLNFTCTKGDANLSKLEIKINGSVVKTVTNPSTTETYTHNISNATTFECVLTDSDNLTGTASASITETVPTYSAQFGLQNGTMQTIANVVSKEYTSAEINVSNDGAKYIYPKTFGALTSILVNGDESISLWTKTEDTNNYTYTQNNTCTGAFVYRFS